MDISALGISAEAERLYRFFLRHPGEGVDSAGQALGLGPDAVAAAAEALAELALIDLTDRHRVLPADPTIAIERLIEQRVDRLNAEIRRVLAARAAIARLARDRRQGDGSAPDVEQVEGQSRVGRRLDEPAFLDDRSPSGLERRVLAALVTADKDETAARELDVSVRTLRRHVAGIMARLGTTNRFQAGVRAKEKGWI